jgi:hypothetical protein
MTFENIIILGFKRSGTSLLRVLLNSHPDIAVGPEIKFMQEATKKYPATLEDFKAMAYREIPDYEYSDETVTRIYNASKTTEDLYRNWCMEYRENTNKKIWGDKTPQNFKYLKFLSKKFPDALYVHIVRHPLDVMISSKRRGQFHGVHTIIAWIVSNWKVRFVKNKNYMFFKYEDFVNDPKKYLDKILERLKVENVDVLSLYQNIHHGKIASGDSWDKPIEAKKRDDEILSTTDKILIRLMCNPYLRKYGYS